MLNERLSAKQLPDGVPCDHRGCLHHVSHPCEGCGRIAGRTPCKDANAECVNLTDMLAAATPELKLMYELCAERERQDSKWGGSQADDSRKTPYDWCLDIEAYNTWACQMYRMESPEKYRRRMMQIAALAIAACESYDRLAANLNSTTPD